MTPVPANALVTALSEQQKQRVDALFDALFDLPEERRINALRDRSGEDAAVVVEVLSLLRAADASKKFLTAPARAPLEPVEPVSPVDAGINRRRD